MNGHFEIVRDEEEDKILWVGKWNTANIGWGVRGKGTFEHSVKFSYRFNILNKYKMNK